MSLRLSAILPKLKDLLIMSPEQLFNEFHKDLYYYIYRRVDCAEDAKDIMQTVFFKVLRADSLNKIQYLWSWLRKIADNTIIDYYRKDKYKVYNNKLEELNISKEIEFCLKLDTINDSMYECFDALMNQLSKEERYIVEQVAIKGVKQIDLAATLEINYNSLRSKYQRATEKLMKWKEECRYSKTYCSLLKTIDRKACSICGKNLGLCT